jgi:hypothetical protein
MFKKCSLNQWQWETCVYNKSLMEYFHIINHENILALNLHEEMVLNLVKILLKSLVAYSNGRCVQIPHNCHIKTMIYMW